MNQNVANTIQLHTQATNSNIMSRTAFLTSCYSGLLFNMDQFSPETVLAWMTGARISGMCRDEVLEMEAISNIIYYIANTDYRKPCFALLSDFMSRLDHSVNGTYYLDNRLNKIVREYLVKGMADAQTRFDLERRQAAALFVVLAYPMLLGANGVIAASIMCDFHLLSCGIGSFIPVNDQINWLRDAIPRWQSTDGCIFNQVGDELISYISENCIWCA